MYQSEYIVAYDQGTSGVKAALVSLDGKLIDYATETYPLYQEYPGHAEQNPEDYWNAICRATAKVMAKTQADPKKARGLVFAAIWKSLIPMDKDMKPLRRSMIWLDSRSSEEAEEMNRQVGDNIYLPLDYWPMLLWFYKNEREIYDKTYKIIGVNTYLGWRATGNLVTNISDSFVFGHDAEQQAMYDRALDWFGLDKNKFVPWVTSSTEIGKLHAKAAEELSLAEGIPVFAGSGDIQAITIGSGASVPGKLHAYFGSSGWMGTVVKFDELRRPKPSPLNETYDTVIGGSKIGLVLNWAIDQFYGAERRELGDGIFDFLEEELKDIPAGSDGLIAVPFLYGGTDRNYGKEYACFFNLHSSHTRRHMLHAVMEGICMTMRMTNQTQLARMDPKVSDTINAVDGGATNDRWMQILANVLNIPIGVPYSPRHVGTIGCAYHALIGLGLYDNYAQAADSVQIEKTFHPDPEAVAVYEKRYAKYCELRKALQPVYQDVD